MPEERKEKNIVLVMDQKSYRSNLKYLFLFYRYPLLNKSKKKDVR